MAAKEVDFYFDFSSTNSYFAAFLLPAICGRNGARVNWLPLHLAALFRGTGFDVMAMHPAKARYLWEDHRRYAELTGLPFRRPSRFPIKTSACLRAVLAVKQLSEEQSRSTDAELSAGAFSQGIFRAYWEHDEDISDRAVIAALASELRMDQKRLFELMEDDQIRAELRAVTERAIQRGVFGAPTFLVGDEMFWGKDRLDFVERSLRR